MKKFLIPLILFPPLAWCDGPIYQHSDALDQQEFVNVYQNIRSPIIISGKASSFTSTTLSAGLLNITGGSTLHYYAGAGTTMYLANNRDTSGTVTNASNASAVIGLNAPTSAGSVDISASPAANGAIAIVGHFSNTGDYFTGTTTNDNAATGNYGEFVSSIWSTISDGATGTFSDAASISLTAGDWDIEVHAEMGINEVASVSRHILGISTTSGNSATGLTQGTTRLDAVVPGSNSNMALTLGRTRASIASTTIYYAKIEGTYTGTTPTSSGILSARRMR